MVIEDDLAKAPRSEGRGAASSQLGDRPGFRERRRESRYPTSDSATLYLGHGPRAERLSVSVVDISRCGLAVTMDLPQPLGARVEVVLPHQIVIFGEVRHCHALSEKFHVGILIHDVIRADVAREHLSDEYLALYIEGTGLTVTQVLRVMDHLLACDVCVNRLQEVGAQRRSGERTAG